MRNMKGEIAQNDKELWQKARSVWLLKFKYKIKYLITKKDALKVYEKEYTDIYHVNLIFPKLLYEKLIYIRKCANIYIANLLLFV